HGKWRAGAHDGRSAAGQGGTILEQSRPAVFRDDFVDRTTKVQIDKIRLDPIDHLSCRFGHVVRIPAEKLHTEWALDLVEVEILLRSVISPEDTLGRNKFGGQNIGPVFFADLAKDLVRHASHRREVKRKA